MKRNNDNRRLLSLDVLRGITVAGMILVNNGYGETFHPLQHSKWNGMTPCDLVFPFFLFIMGVSTYLSLRKFQFRPSAGVIAKILRRTLLIFLIGLGINWFDLAVGGDWLPFSTIRIFAVLQRIALCYCVVSIFALMVPLSSRPAKRRGASRRADAIIITTIVALLAVYSLILLLGNGYACDPSNILARVDRSIFGEAHLYHKSPVDPEGLLGTIPSIAHTLIGFYCGKLMTETLNLSQKIRNYLVVGIILILCGYLLQFALPLNKRIWSPSYVLMTCGLAATLQAILMYLIDLLGWKRWTVPFQVFGINPLFLYVLSELMAIFFGHFGVSDLIYQGVHALIAAPKWASLAYALTFVLLCFLAGWPLYRRRIYIKI